MVGERFDFDFIQVNHGLFFGSFSSILGSRPAAYRSNFFAKPSPCDLHPSIQTVKRFPSVCGHSG
jgi:hypothetical protein